jgi:hypothetical protein
MILYSVLLQQITTQPTVEYRHKVRRSHGEYEDEKKSNGNQIAAESRLKKFRYRDHEDRGRDL